jgi:hypothetical protein
MPQEVLPFNPLIHVVLKARLQEVKSFKTQFKSLGELVGTLGDVFSEVTLVAPSER